MIGFIVDRMHVSTSDRDIVREFYRRMRRGPRIPRFNRRALYARALARHHANQRLCRDFRL